jgi:hypothetical protein
MIAASTEPDDVAKTLLALILGFVAQAAILGEVDPEMMSEACESSAGIYRNGLTFLTGGTVVARDSGRSYFAERHFSEIAG